MVRIAFLEPRSPFGLGGLAQGTQANESFWRDGTPPAQLGQCESLIFAAWTMQTLTRCPRGGAEKAADALAAIISMRYRGQASCPSGDPAGDRSQHLHDG